MSTLQSFLEKAVDLGAEGVEIEYKDGDERIFAMRGATGVGVGTIKSGTPESRQLIKAVKALGKVKRLRLRDRPYRAVVSEFDSFGETAYRVTLSPSPERRDPGM